MLMITVTLNKNNIAV